MKAVLFDMDGVIIDSEPIHFEIDVKTMAYYGIDVLPQELEKYVGMTNPEMWRLIKKEYSISQTVDEIISYQLKKKIHRLRNMDIEPIEGITELLFELRKKGIKTAVASSSPRIFIEEVLNKFNLMSCFECIVSGEELERGKPAPDIYIETARALGVTPEECIVIEDSRNGVLSAKEAGMECIGFKNVNSGNQDLSRADWIVNSIKAIKMRNIIG